MATISRETIQKKKEHATQPHDEHYMRILDKQASQIGDALGAAIVSL